MNGKPRIRRGVVAVVGFLALAVVPVLALNSLATADTGPGSVTEGGAGAPRALSDAQRQCLAAQGVTLPTRPADGTRPEITEEQRTKLRAAAEACDLPVPHRHGPRPALSDAQRQCLAAQGVTLPTRPADGTRPEITEEQRTKLRDAAEACGLPTGPRAARLATRV